MVIVDVFEAKKDPEKSRKKELFLNMDYSPYFFFTP